MRHEITVAGLRLLVVVLGAQAVILPTTLAALGAKLLPCLVLVVLHVIAAAVVSVHADSLES